MAELGWTDRPQWEHRESCSSPTRCFSAEIRSPEIRVDSRSSKADSIFTLRFLLDDFCIAPCTNAAAYEIGTVSGKISKTFFGGNRLLFRCKSPKISAVRSFSI